MKVPDAVVDGDAREADLRRVGPVVARRAGRRAGVHPEFPTGLGGRGVTCRDQCGVRTKTFDCPDVDDRRPGPALVPAVRAVVADRQRRRAALGAAFAALMVSVAPSPTPTTSRAATSASTTPVPLFTGLPSVPRYPASGLATPPRGANADDGDTPARSPQLG